MSIFLRESDLNSMRQSGKILADTIKEAKKYILPGMKTAFIDEIVEKFIVQRGARPAFKGYRGFPASLCISTVSYTHLDVYKRQPQEVCF